MRINCFVLEVWTWALIGSAGLFAPTAWTPITSQWCGRTRWTHPWQLYCLGLPTTAAEGAEGSPTLHYTCYSFWAADSSLGTHQADFFARPRSTVTVD
jgi:hypothetical protein